jgi:lysophospholipase L1-like esterase
MKYVLLSLLSLSAICQASLPSGKSWTFDFGAKTAPSGTIAVAAGDNYSPEKGYGFELAALPTLVTRQKGDAFTKEHLTSNGGFYFSAELPEGNYLVTLKLGDTEGISQTTVKAECRRLMLENITTKPGEIRSESFVVNVRRPEFGNDRVKLKAREVPYLHWDNKLTLEFNGEHPCVDAISITAVENVTTVYLLGDSTVTDQPYEPWNSWGQMLPRFFGPKISVANYAESGETIKSSTGAKRVAKVLSNLRSGDYVLIQFGHNDMKDKAPDALEVFKKNLAATVQEIRKKGATPVLITPMERKNGVSTNTLAGYPDAFKEVAKQEKLSLIDLHEKSQAFYKALGPDRINLAFQDGTHHNNYGSYELARLVVEGLREAAPELVKQLRPEVPHFDPGHPDDPATFKMAVSPLKDRTKPDGD